MSAAFSTTPFRSVHDVNVKSKNNRSFVVDIYDAGGGTYDSTVTVLDRVSVTPGSWLYQVKPASASASDNFRAAIELIKDYLATVDQTDSIADVHNPCNCPFVSQQDQDQILSHLNVHLNVRVN